jgi:hypothetical protein
MMLAKALAAGMTPRELERLIRGHASKEQIADAFGLSVAIVEAMMARWGLAHLSGRAKSNVRLVRDLETKQ